MVAPTPSSPLDFRPDDALAARIIADLAEPEGTLASVAELHNISRATLTLWLNTSDARARMLDIERGSAAHIRMTASLHLAAAIDTLVHILDDYRHSRNPSSASSSATPNPTVGPTVVPAGALQLLPLAAALKADANSSRRAETARKAAYTLHRLCRYTPLTEEQIEADVRRHLQAQLQRAQLHKSQINNPYPQNSQPHKSPPHAPRPQPAPAQHAPPQHTRPQPPSPQPHKPPQPKPIHAQPQPLKPQPPTPQPLKPQPAASNAFKTPSNSRSPSHLLLTAGSATGPP